MSEPDVVIDRDLTYATGAGGRTLHADVYRPREGRPRAAILYFHGGGWEVGARTDYEVTRPAALAGRGFLVASVTYRLTGEAVFPAQLDDARDAAAWLRGQLEAYDVQSDRIGAWGASAGGHLAALLALGNPKRREEPAVDAAAAWFAPLDLSVESGGTPLEKELFPASPVNGLLGAAFDPADPGHRAADPISLVSPDAAPMFLATGDRDRVVQWTVSARLHDALVRAGVPSVLQVFGAAGHEDPALEKETGIGSIAAFFGQHLG